ncbi:MULTISPECIES: restriction endonuclease [unclassified Acinetobacter]|uniref:restriction endonuclease n=1 Tax=unclassified Acinetobacter TaxID=196816 RepID=UPI00244898F5|nr:MULTISPECIES: restriction endonuclease [unclassified Acinetobacter]MDH0030333.1 restriction endonuclease [Acinetobacter sp. GD04021]MDH0885901.1 restriction endonuclease [Acinetobacter sp. GD03873]MDH1082521.1 restriction endonuclease [Acinetobacter sp. GD03983]MDH2189087.1 restriction endonuclease [Acinetobacter sp. GD03645]MDH2202275.1 restriction endonuclease [Acinetobacter sp. GD03647]
MNRYDSFFRPLTPEQWEFFAQDFFSWLGYRLVSGVSRGPDGGKDLIVVDQNNKRCLVSCKHYLNSGQAIGLSHEDQFVERLVQHDCQVFIGFYSTSISTSLQTRFEQIESNPSFSYKFIVYDYSAVCSCVGQMPLFILQKYGPPNLVGFVQHVSAEAYQPLHCMACGVDILTDKMIPFSLVTMVLDTDDQLSFVYGCKRCFGQVNIGVEPYGWGDMSQVLHHDQMIVWNSIVQQAILGSKLHPSFWECYTKFSLCTQQRLSPAGFGTWLGGQIVW